MFLLQGKQKQIMIINFGFWTYLFSLHSSLNKLGIEIDYNITHFGFSLYLIIDFITLLLCNTLCYLKIRNPTSGSWNFL